MNYKHLSIDARSCIRKYYVEGLSYRKIAQLIGRSPSTVSREIRRNCTHMYDIPTYYPHTAQKKYLLRRSYCHRGMFRSQATIEYRNEKLKATWSQEQIACTPCGLKMPSWRTIEQRLGCKCILPVRTVRGKRARMKMQTACFERFIRKAEICRVLLLPL